MTILYALFVLPVKMSVTAVSGDTAGVTTRGVLPHTPVNHTVFS